MSGNSSHNIELALSGEEMEALDRIVGRTGNTREEIAAQALRYFLLKRQGGNAVYLSAPINALVEGIYVENTTIRQIREHGDFGLGTFNHLDGEMVLLDGKVYQVRSDGRVYSVNDDEYSPFACVTFFTPDTFDDIEGTFDNAAFSELLDRLIPSRNMLYAIRIDGTFDYAKTRAVPKTEGHVPLVEVAKHQPVFEFHNITGSIAGFYTPRFMESLSAPGYHLHLLTGDANHGGHLMECTLKKARIGIQHIPVLELALPMTFDYLTADFIRDTGKDLDKVE